MKNIIEKVKYYFEYKFLTGHISIGRLKIYGRNAMHWGCRFYTKKYGYICWRLPLPCFGHWFPLYLYFSPNATPWAATFMIGKKHSEADWVRSNIRYLVLGHNFKSDEYNEEFKVSNYEVLREINNLSKFDIYRILLECKGNE